MTSPPPDWYLRAATLRLLQGLPVTLPGRVGPIRRRGIDAGAPFAGALPGSVAARREPVMTAWALRPKESRMASSSRADRSPGQTPL
jgi:hypothetical protein